MCPSKPEYDKILQPEDDVFCECNMVLKSQARILFLQVIRPTFPLTKVFLLVPAHSGGKFFDG